MKSARNKTFVRDSASQYDNRSRSYYNDSNAMTKS